MTLTRFATARTSSARGGVRGRSPRRGRASAAPSFTTVRRRPTTTPAEAAYSCVSGLPSSDPTPRRRGSTPTPRRRVRLRLRRRRPRGVPPGGPRDPISAFGGIVPSTELTADMAREIREFRPPPTTRRACSTRLSSRLAHRGGSRGAQGQVQEPSILEAKPCTPSSTLRQVGGGWLQQSSDSSRGYQFTAVSETQPTEEQLDALKFAWRCVKHVKSNAITVATKGRSSAWAAAAQPRELGAHRDGEGCRGGGGFSARRMLPYAGRFRGDCVPGGRQGHRAPGRVHARSGRGRRVQQVRVALVTTGHRHFRH